MQHCDFLYGEVQRKLQNEPVKDEEHLPTDTGAALELIEEFRQALLNVDTRLSEVVEIVEGYKNYTEEEDTPEVLKG